MSTSLTKFFCVVWGFIFFLLSFSIICVGAYSSEPPPGREYEMVTPVENYDADVYVPYALEPEFLTHFGEISTRLPFQVSTEGEAVAYVADPTSGGTGRTGLGEGNEYIVRQSPTGEGWATPTNIQPTNASSAFYEAFSSDLNIGILDSGWFEEPETPSLAPQAPGEGYSVLYAYSLGDDNYSPLFSVRPPNRSPAEFYSPGTPIIYPPVRNELAFAGASADFSQIIFEANDALTSNSAQSNQYQNNLYLSRDGQLALVNVLPDGSTEAGATFGAPPLPNQSTPNFDNVISASGTRVIWSDLNPGKENLYMTEDVGLSPQKTVQVDSSNVPGHKGGGGRFWAANKAGTDIIFSDKVNAGLTADTQIGEGNGEDLYIYEPVTARLTNLTPEVNAEVQGVVGVGETEAKEFTVYFVARGILGNNQNSDGAMALEGEDNLYVLTEAMMRQGRKPIFIMTLSPEDGSKAIPLVGSALGDWQLGVGHRTSEVAPNGEALVFMSNDPTGSGQFREFGGAKLEEVYVYEAQKNGNGELSCASCGDNNIQIENNSSSRNKLGAFLPVSWSSTYQPDLISDNGAEVFFDSDEPLVSQDTNGAQDVYEWERGGSGSCREQAGCVDMLSGGLGSSSSWLIGASVSGDDVFFATRAQLVPTATYDAYNLYDARVGAASPVLSPTCTDTDCQGLPAASPAFTTPASITFDGPGDISAPSHTGKNSIRTKGSPKRRKIPAIKRRRKGKNLSAKGKDPTRRDGGHVDHIRKHIR
jgi:hypothetical protein